MTAGDLLKLTTLMPLKLTVEIKAKTEKNN